MPTKEEYEKLIKNTANEWVKNYKGIHGLNGKLFTAENGNTLFFPAAGYFNGSERYNIGNDCYIWTSSLDTDDPDYAFSFYFDSDVVGIYGSNRYDSFPVRGFQIFTIN